MSASIEQLGPRWLPLPFMPEMVQATLDGRKTQTRRVMKPQPVEKTDPDRWVMRVNSTTTVSHPDGRLAAASARCPYGQPGDRLWVRERQRVIEVGMLEDVRQIRVRYEADGAESGWIDYPSRLKGEPIVGKCLSYGGYRESSRLTLEVTSIGVERLWRISEADARAEGVTVPPSTEGEEGNSAVWEFTKLWQSVNGKRPGCSWSENPWVWVVGFRRVES